MNESESLKKFIGDQMSVWPLCATNFRALKTARTKEMEINGLKAVVQNNPQRRVSTDADPIAAESGLRPCFLCESGRFPQQQAYKFEGRKGRKYDIMVNPFPIFPDHITVVSAEHTPQTIMNRFQDMTDVAHHFTDFTIFYNGPRSGASAPDHMHFQACPRMSMPLEAAVDKLLDQEGSDSRIKYISSVKEASLYQCDIFTKGIFAMKAKTSKSLAKLFYRLIDCIPVPEGEREPRVNIVMWYKPLSGASRPKGSTHGLADFEYRVIVLLRDEGRPSCYFAQGEDHLRFSPGCAEMAGYLILPDEEDFDKATPEMFRKAFEEVSVKEDVLAHIVWRLTRTQRTIQVGVLSSDEIVFEIISDGAGPQKVSYQEGKINYNGALYDELFFEAQTPSKMFAEPTFILHDVIIGVDFHWQRKVDQQFGGSLKFIVEKGKVVAVNVIGIEDYLLSVISSEMKSSATLEFLKAHSVISRSWVLSQVEHRERKKAELPEGVNDVVSLVTDLDTKLGGEAKEDAVPGTYIKWFDHEDHINFDVCADDHCQRYQGLTMAVGGKVREAIDQTWGLVLKDKEGEICDCRFYKSCGGQTELFSTCWADKDYDYLPSLPDTPDHDPHGHCFCNTHDKEILSQVLNDYDLETVDFYEWKVEYTRQEVSDLFKRRSGMDVGTIQDLIPVEKGPSGTIKKLKVVGDKATVIIGKELIVRRFLSDSHLKSARFTVTWEGDKLILNGSGWGHCVGLCQIGAAVMAYSGYNFRQILEHYYPGSQLEKI